MKIRKLEVCGFKSFVDRTVLHFDHEVTCIVGPNGCGKSNVVDAIRWVMGEQSAKQLRGKAMDDVIFNGSESRGPHGFAEVSLTFDNTDGLGPPEYKDYSEITVTRRLDRSGHSEYLVNKTPVRLMDVTNLFLGTGVGKRAYSIIEQGRIGLIVSAKPEDRRQLIEEAAGITKFKAKKKAAERKMEQTRQNLLRVSDVIGEIEKSLASLKRQAQKAERYKRYREEIRDLELWIASHRWLELSGRHRVLRSQVEQTSATAEGARAALRVREAEVEVERLVLQEHESRVEQAQTKAYELDNAVKLLESQISHHVEQLESLGEREASAERELEVLGGQRSELSVEAESLQQRLETREEVERQEAEALDQEMEVLEERKLAAQEAELALKGARDRVAEADTRIARAEAVLQSFEKRRAEGRQRLERLQTERQRLTDRLAELRQEAVELRARLEGLRSGQSELSTQKDALETELVRLREEVRVSEGRVERTRGELNTKRSRLRSLEEIQQRFEGVGAGVRALMTRFENPAARAEAGVLGLVADRIQCAEDLTRALAGALGSTLEHVVVDRLGSGLDAIRYLREDRRGRATLWSREGAQDGQPAADVSPQLQAQLASQPGVVGWLASLVQVEAEDGELAQRLLHGVLVVEDLESAVRLHEQGLNPHALVTRQGEVLRKHGALTGGEGDDGGEHMLQVKREIRELHAVVARLDEELSEAVDQHGALRQSIAERQAALDAAKSDAHDKEIAVVKADRDLSRAEEAAQETTRSIESLHEQVHDLERALGEADDEELGAQQERREAIEAKEHAQEALSGAEEVYAQRRDAVEEQGLVATEVRVRAAEARQQAEADRSAFTRLRRSIEELEAREERLRTDRAGFSEQQERLSAQLVTSREALSERTEQAMAAQDETSRLRAEYDAAREGLSAQELALRELRGRIETVSQEASQVAMQEREVAIEVEHMLQQVQERHRVDVRLVLTDYHARELPDQAVRDRVDELHRVVERMGEIHLTAIEEYEERSQRYEYLTAQRADLETALGQLDKAIRQMNRESRRLFKDTFDSVNERFQRMFPRMFGGGRGELRLTNPDDLLESGIEIIAMPPGKRLGSIELMSGGEKALTAVSLIFAIFQFKPSPFCLLDEVDAPLDEANIGRFCDMIRQMTGHSQFILITHSKRTMELGDVLYGVTMETAGISKLVSVELRGAERGPSSSPTTDDAQQAVA